MTYTRLAWTLLAIALLIVAVFEGIIHGWVTAGIIVVFALLPDMTLISAFGGERGVMRPERVAFYNGMHQAWIPALLFFIGGSMAYLWEMREIGLPLFWAGMAWLLHIALDRTFGFGLRAPDGTIIPVGSYGPRKR
ncbi:DUF4260 family protein [Microbacterium sp. bgisy207]|uniref:DUF4260 family protein n=1 Tax=Microbacterium sp. bgisy207 TaxID=3413800 RepID=UPI003EB734FB